MSTVSVIIPQHNRSELTVATVGSLLAHHRQKVEIIIVSDGCSSEEKERLHAAIGGKCRIIGWLARQGVTLAWNRAAGIATGDRLVFLNNDTITHGEWIPKLVAPLSGNEARIMGTGYRREPDWPSRLRPIHPQGLVLTGWCLALNRDTWRELGGFDEQFPLYYSDTDLQCRILLQTGSAQTLLAVDHLPLRHLEHASTRGLPTRREQWREDRERFLQKWNGDSA